MGWFPTIRNEEIGWRFDIVSLLAVIGESTIERHVQVITASPFAFFPRLSPAPQAVLKTDRPTRLPSIKDVVVMGVHSGTRLTELNFFADAIHEVNQLQPYEFRVYEIEYAHKPRKVTPDSDDLEKQPEQPTDRSNKATATATTKPADEVIHIPLKRNCALNLVIAVSVLLTAGLLAWAGGIGDGVAMIAIATMSLSTSLACLSSSWQPVLAARPTSAAVPDGDVVIGTRNGAMVVVYCTEEITRELYSGPENCRYRFSDRPHRALQGTSTVLLMASVVLFSNCGWTMQTAIGVSYMILNILFWAIPLLMDRRDTWDLSRYKITPRNPALPPTDEKPSFTQTLWRAIYETKRTDWVVKSQLAPTSPYWDLWLQEALVNCNKAGWDAVGAKNRLMDLAKQNAEEQMRAARRQTAPASMEGQVGL